MSTTFPHPDWCERRHINEWPCHTADVGDVETDGTVISVEVAQYAPARPAVVSVKLHTYEETRVLDLAPDRAYQLIALLTTAIDVLDGHCLPRGGYDRDDPETGAPLPPGVEGYAPGTGSGGAR